VYEKLLSKWVKENSICFIHVRASLKGRKLGERERERERASLKERKLGAGSSRGKIIFPKSLVLCF
jgi:hypothetical protein